MQYLWSHVALRAHVRRRLLALRQPLAQAQVRQHQVAALRDQAVAGLDISARRGWSGGGVVGGVVGW